MRIFPTQSFYLVNRKNNKNHHLTIKRNLLTFAYWCGLADPDIYVEICYLLSSCEDKQKEIEIHWCAFLSQIFSGLSPPHLWVVKLFPRFSIRIGRFSPSSSYLWIALSSSLDKTWILRKKEKWIEINIFSGHFVHFQENWLKT